MFTKGRVSRYAPFVLLLCCLACDSRKTADKSQQKTSSATKATTAQLEFPQPAQPSANPQATKQEDSITYAKDPGRFVKMPTTPPPFNIKSPKTAQEHFNVAVDHDNKQEFDQAILEYQKALQMQPKWALAHFRAGKDYVKTDHLDNAIAQFKAATLDDPDFYDAYYELALAYKKKGDQNHAIEAFSKLLEFPSPGVKMSVHYQLGMWYADLGERSRAREHLESYKELALQNKTEQQGPHYKDAMQELEKLSR